MSRRLISREASIGQSVSATTLEIITVKASTKPNSVNSPPACPGRKEIGMNTAASVAAELAAEAFVDGFDPVRIAVAKSRAGEAAGIAAPLAHQLHGAIGVTEEYQLHYFTRQLWAGRDEFGTEREWNELVGRAALQQGPDGLWPFLTAL